MKFNALLKELLLILPKEVPKETDYKSYLKQLFDDYLILISQIEDAGKIIGLNKKMTIDLMLERQAEFASGILDTVSLYYDGKPSEAFGTLCSTIDKRIEKNRQMFRIGKYESGESFYRIRTGKDNFLFKGLEMFHIPFEQRGNVSSQRYSIPGFPSLYLGKTIYVCWEELKRPDLNTFQVARLENKCALEFIDLTPPDFSSGYYNIKVFAYLMIWPLIASCSIKVQNPNNYFKPEYIIPQLLLQWVRNTRNVDGIRYNSTNIPMSTIYRKGEYYNLVFPVKSSGDSGHCPELMKCFKISDPVSWQSIQVTEGGGEAIADKENKTNYIDNKLPNLKIYNNYPTRYSKSVLGKLEFHLDLLDLI